MRVNGLFTSHQAALHMLVGARLGSVTAPSLPRFQAHFQSGSYMPVDGSMVAEL
jgi:hypothetical protein